MVEDGGQRPNDSKPLKRLAFKETLRQVVEAGGWDC
jgi:hypothetical protein